MFAIGPEDFIVNKLARKDRGVQDEKDVISVLSRQKGKLDYIYLENRAKRAGVGEVLMVLMEKLGTVPPSTHERDGATRSFEKIRNHALSG